MFDEANDVFLIGDLNARFGDESGNTVINARGAAINKTLSTLTRIRPQRNIPTYINRTTGHCSTPDHAFSNSNIQHTLEVVELGMQSDHRPLVLHCNLNEDRRRFFNKPNFARWNLGALRNAARQRARKDALEDDDIAEVTTHLRQILDDPQLHSGGYQERSARVETAYSRVKRWTEKAIQAAVGIFNSAHLKTNEFWTLELVNLEQQIHVLEEICDDSRRPAVIRNGAHMA